MVRILSAWLGLTYVYASAVGAVGVGGCVHAVVGAGEGHGHASHSSVASHETPAHTPIPLPCAAGEDEAPTETLSDHGTYDPCDCLGDCSVGTGLAGLSTVSAFAVLAPADSETFFFTGPDVAASGGQHRLPYPNAPPLF